MSNKILTVKDKQYGEGAILERGSSFFGFVPGFVGAARVDDQGTMAVEYDGLETSYAALKKCLEDNNFEIIAE